MTFTFPITDNNGEASGSITVAYSGPLSPTGLTITDFYMLTTISGEPATTKPTTTAIPVGVETQVHCYHRENSYTFNETKLLWSTNNDYTTITLEFHCYEYYHGDLQSNSHRLTQFTLTGTIA